MSEHSSPGNDTLLPCPLCGSKAAICILEDEPGETLSAWVACDCGLEIRERLTEAEAVKRWNTRTPAQGAREREVVTQWMIKHSYATGHGDTIDDMLGELVHQVHANALLESHRVETAQVASLRLCGYCKSWHSKPCGEGCVWELTAQTLDDMLTTALVRRTTPPTPPLPSTSRGTGA